MSPTPRYVVTMQRADTGIVVAVLGPWVHATAAQVLDGLAPEQRVYEIAEDGERHCAVVPVYTELHRVIPLREVRLLSERS